MSKFVDSVIAATSIGFVILSTIVFYPLVSGGISKMFFSEPGFKDRWVALEKGTCSYPGELDKKWARSIFNNIKVEIKLRDHILQEPNVIDLAYKVSALLKRPVFAKGSQTKEADYRVYLEFKFIDEDGFVIGKVSNEFLEWMKPEILHESYREDRIIGSDLKYQWSNKEDHPVIEQTLLTNKLHPNIVKKVKRIIFEPNIKFTRIE